MTSTLGSMSPYRVLPRQSLATVAWGGDVNIGRRFHYGSRRPGREGTGLAAITPLREADLGIVNLECVVATCGEQGLNKNERASFYYRARPEMLRALVDGGVDIVATANNHSGDYGPEALLEQRAWLDAVGIAHAGSGRNLHEALLPAIRRAGNLNVALFSLDATQRSFGARVDRPGHAYLPLSDPERWRQVLAPLISEARRHAHVVLVAVHWGANNKAEPGPQEIAAGHAIIDAGADAVLGASAHMLQGVEIYMDRPIIHDAGDLLFDALRRESSDSGIFTLELDYSGVQRIRFSPVEVGFCSSLMPQGANAVAAARRFLKRNAGFDTPLAIAANGECVLDLSPPSRGIEDVLPAPATIYNLAAIRELSKAGSGYAVDQVPEDARLAAPVRLGPLELIGAKMAPEFLNRRGLLFVESYWRLVESTAEDWRLDFRAHPADTRALSDWGISNDHDPCDWQLPTSRMNPGTIYRDYYGLRPPSVISRAAARLQLSVAIKNERAQTDRILLQIYSKFEFNPAELSVPVT